MLFLHTLKYVSSYVYYHMPTCFTDVYHAVSLFKSLNYYIKLCF